MALTTLANIRLIPGFEATSPYSDAYLNLIITGVDKAIKNFCQQALELAEFTEYYSGTGTPDLVLKQMNVLSGTTTVTVASNGVALPTATINVASTTNFPSSGTLSIQSGVSSVTAVTYTGKTGTTFTGCAGGTGTLATSYAVGCPVVYVDPQGAWGQSPTAFGSGTQLTNGVMFAVNLGRGGVTSQSGILKRLGFGGAGFIGWGGFPQSYGTGFGKLAASRLPVWPLGYGNIKVIYPAGFATVPGDLVTAANQLVTYVARNQPLGGLTPSSEGYESYSYSLMAANSGSSSSGDPELGTIRSVLVRYRDTPW